RPLRLGRFAQAPHRLGALPDDGAVELDPVQPAAAPRPRGREHNRSGTGPVCRACARRGGPGRGAPPNPYCSRAGRGRSAVLCRGAEWRMASRRDRPRPARDARRVCWRRFAAAPGLAAPAADATGRAARAAATRAAAAHPAHRGRGRVEPACESYLFWGAALARHRRAARLPGPHARAAARPPLSRHGGRLWSVLATRWALLCRRAPKLLQVGRGGPIALRGGTLGGLALGLETSRVRARAR